MVKIADNQKHLKGNALKHENSTLINASSSAEEVLISDSRCEAHDLGDPIRRGQCPYPQGPV